MHAWIHAPHTYTCAQEHMTHEHIHIYIYHHRGSISCLERDSKWEEVKLLYNLTCRFPEGCPFSSVTLSDRPLSPLFFNTSWRRGPQSKYLTYSMYWILGTALQDSGQRQIWDSGRLSTMLQTTQRTATQPASGKFAISFQIAHQRSHAFKDFRIGSWFCFIFETRSHNGSLLAVLELAVYPRPT